MQQKVIINKGKRYLVNVPTDDGVGAGFAIGQLVLKSISDKFWYVAMSSGSAGSVITFVSQSQLTSFGTSSYYDQNYPYQLLGATNGNTYALYLSGSDPNASLVVSQSAYTGSSQPKPNLILQNITDYNYYTARLNASASIITLVVDQTTISQSYVHPIY